MPDRTPLRPLGVGEVLDVAFDIVLEHWRTLLKAVAVLVIPLQLVSIAILAAVIPDADLINNQNAWSGKETDIDVSGSDLAALGLGYGLVLLLSFVLAAVAIAALFKAVSDAYLGATPDWRASLAFARGRILSVLWVTTLVGLGVALGLIALILPAIWLYISWSVAVTVLLAEGLKGTKALGRSFRLVKGRWWKTFGTLLVGLILAGVVGGAFGAAVGAISNTSLGDSVFGAAVLNGISTGLGQMISLPVTIAIVTVLYFDLLVRSDAVDLETLRERLGVSADAGSLPRAAQPVAGWGAAGPPPTAPGWQSAPAGPWQGSGGWQGPEPPSTSEAPPQPPQAGPGAGGWAPPRPPGAPDQGDEDRAS